MPQQKTWSGSGVILSFFKLRNTAEISLETIEIWFNEEYFPALLGTGAITSAVLYKAANPSYDKQYLLVYDVPDLSSVAGKIQLVERSSKQSLFKGIVDDYVDNERRIYTFLQLYETKQHDEDSPPAIMLAMMQPGEGKETDLDAWYRDEHNQQMSEQPGWLKTTRYSLLAQHSSTDQTSLELSFLAIHAFDKANQLGTEVKALEPMSNWTKKVMSEAKGIDAAIYHKQKSDGRK
ncbi:hypothetical protein EK21DRAFT_53970 [Setomelanomma holmii]|uniref:Uncharacterized protein n=1 Tax=Setomelanomma holmii TaxID=210430 RepID=A0A9P4LRN7_9PLEO|nr:hypothetical protein EK21DRAFT_53970 [Setomelanomma holmii]